MSTHDAPDRSRPDRPVGEFFCGPGPDAIAAPDRGSYFETVTSPPEQAVPPHVVGSTHDIEAISSLEAKSRRGMSVFPKPMMTKIGLAALAASLAFGGVQLGLASDAPKPGDATLRQPLQDAATMVNRSGKSDREAGASRLQSATISFEVDGLAATSIVMRLPAADRIDTDAIKPAPARPSRQKAMIACEPVVSPLTDVAKLLGPGRCVT